MWTASLNLKNISRCTSSKELGIYWHAKANKQGGTKDQSDYAFRNDGDVDTKESKKTS